MAMVSECLQEVDRRRKVVEHGEERTEEVSLHVVHAQLGSSCVHVYIYIYISVVWNTVSVYYTCVCLE